MEKRTKKHSCQIQKKKTKVSPKVQPLYNHLIILTKLKQNKHKATQPKTDLYKMSRKHSVLQFNKGTHPAAFTLPLFF